MRRLPSVRGCAETIFFTHALKWADEAVGTFTSAARRLDRHHEQDASHGCDRNLDTSPVDPVFDTVGGDRLKRSPAVLREGGRLVSVAEQWRVRLSVPSDATA